MKATGKPATPRCWTRRCRWFGGIGGGTEEEGQFPWCLAYPNGIPAEIAYGRNPHTEPYPGDGGIRYERDKRRRR